MANSEGLRQRLLEYRTAIEKHLSFLQEDCQQIEKRWLALNAVYEGEAAEEFRASWLRTQGWFQDYIAQMQGISVLVNERIEALELTEPPEGVTT